MGLKELKNKWDATPQKGILPDGAKMRMWESIEKATLKKRRLPTYQWLAAACIAAVLSFTGYQLLTLNVSDTKMIITQTYPNDVRLLRLPDGSKVWVNQDTKIEYPEIFEGNTRNVTLEGEAYFEVAKDASKPFIITSGTITTTVLGTSFSITSYKCQAPEVRVRTGKVKVATNTDKVYLEKGYAAIYQPETSTLNKQTTPTLEPYWKKALIDIDGYTLSEVINELKKDHAFTVSYSTEDLKLLKIKGTLDSRQGFKEMLQTIAFALQVKIETTGPNTFRISR